MNAVLIPILVSTNRHERHVHRILTLTVFSNVILPAGDYDNRYPIHLAAAEGEVVSVHFLTYAHADVSVRDRWG